MIFDTAVIGKGLIGTAVTRYLSQAGLATAVIGPDEPPDIQTHTGIFASHYDQGRITRQLSKDKIWSALARRAIRQYETLQQQSGIHFYEPVGGLYVSQAHRDRDYLAELRAIAASAAIQFDTIPAVDIQTRFPFLQFPDHFQIIHEPAPAGYINPRDLIRAQLNVARQHKATILAQTVLDIQQVDGLFSIMLNNQQTVWAKNIVVCAGAFTNCHNLLPQKLDLKVKSETIILAEISKESARQLSSMPTVIYQIESEQIDDIYLLPPIRYPDGRLYLKMGCNTVADQYLPDLRTMQNWMIQGNADVSKAVMQNALQAILPNIPFISVQTKRCLVTYTPHGYPFIDQIAEGVYVATGGNGSSAKSSDAIGKVAADMLIYDGWGAEFTRESFKASFA